MTYHHSIILNFVIQSRAELSTSIGDFLELLLDVWVFLYT
jgi:hypothetical protein